MTKLRPTRKRATGASGAKALIATASVAATLGGWAALTHMQTEPIDTATSPPALAPLQLSSELRLDPLPLPTIVQPPQLVIDRPPTIPAALLSAPAPAAARPAAQQPEPPVVSALPLRVVTAPPQPVARTRSSR